MLAFAALTACDSVGPTDPGGAPVTINWAQCINDVDFPTWFAFQDGTGAWVRVTPTNGVFTFAINSGKGGVATFASNRLSIIYATGAEMDANKPTCTGSRRTVNGTVSGYATLDDINIQMDQTGASVSGTTAAPAPFQLTGVAPGAVDVLGVRSRSTATTSTFTLTPNAVFIRRAQSTSPMAVIDLNSTTESGAPLSKTLTVANAASNDNLYVTTSLNTPTTGITLAQSSTSLGTVTGNVSALSYGLASTRLATGDMQMLSVFAIKTVSSSVSENRFVTVTYTDVVDRSVTLGSTLGTVTVTGTARPGATYTIQAGYDQIFEFDLDQGTGAAARAIVSVMTRGYAGATATGVTLAVPDLTGVAGFQSAWLMSPGLSANWSFIAASATLDAINSKPQAYTAASRSSTFTP